VVKLSSEQLGCYSKHGRQTGFMSICIEVIGKYTDELNRIWQSREKNQQGL